MRVWLVILLFSIPWLGGGVNRKNKEGAELYKEGKLDEALAAFTQAQVESPEAAEIHYNIGNVHYRKEEMDQAMGEYLTALRGDRDLQQRAHYNLGNVRYRGQDFHGAYDAYKQALKINPDDIEARQNLELCLGGGDEKGEEDEGDQEDLSDPKSQQQQEEQEQDQQQQQERQQQSQQDQREMSQEEAERILAALAEMEKDEQRRQQQKQQIKVRGKKKDW